jgi:hypothetical protein
VVEFFGIVPEDGLGIVYFIAPFMSSTMDERDVIFSE